MNLLVFAQTPPPVHGQSVMVQALLEGLRDTPGLTLHHVNFRLSRDNADIGSWRPAKILQTLALCWRAVRLRFRHDCDTLYYVPAPPEKRGALYRDWVVMALCRPFFRRVILHWHSVGLGEWSNTRANSLERVITHALLGRANLSIVLTPSLLADAAVFRPLRTAVVPNGVRDSGPPAARPSISGRSRFLFLGLCSEEKGLFAAAEAVLAANRTIASGSNGLRFELVAAGPFPDADAAARFDALTRAHPNALRHVGFVHGPEKEQLWRTSDCLILPTRYSAEALPLVVLEAFAQDLPVIGTRWRGLPDIVPSDCGILVPPGDTAALVNALATLQLKPLSPGARRAWFLQHFELGRHIAALRKALLQLDSALD